ncbi:YjjG family noncanonical pyrimidine nucleotidase [Paenibacillus sp. GCM10027627]|uniref:YjjG family noncanonical pyrimidine nucleotidase n=1 Tax=unclassified Paenibacillus TaxID=185978 RepID=UPI003643FBC8
MTYELILFDADDTLYDYAKAEAFALQSAFEEAGLTVSPHLTEGYRTINGQLWLDYEKGLIGLAKLRTERFARLIAEHRLELHWTADEFSSSYLRYLGEGSFMIEGAHSLCNELRAKGLKLAIITNGIREVQHSRIGRSPLANAFEHIVVSEDAGAQKPNPLIFDYALQKLGHSDRSRMLMVGDSLTSDIQGGLNAGIDTCWFNPHGKVNSTGIVPRYEISRLEQLLDLIR